MPGGRQRKSKNSRRRQKTAQQRSKGMSWCFGPPAVVDDAEPVISMEKPRRIIGRRKEKNQVSDTFS